LSEWFACFDLGFLYQISQLVDLHRQIENNVEVKFELIYLTFQLFEEISLSVFLVEVRLALD
jgi:hypothetical protein